MTDPSASIRDPLAFVRAIARTVPAPQAWRDDLVSAGCVALVEAARTYDASLGLFPAYAAARVRFGVLDERRRLDALRGRWRGMPPERYPQWVPIEGWRTEALCPAAADARVPRPATALDLLERGELARRVSAALEAIDERSRLVLSLYYLEDLTYRELGAILGLTEARICQIHAHALVLLRAQLDGTGPDAPTRSAQDGRRRARLQARGLRLAARASVCASAQAIRSAAARARRREAVS